MVVLVPGRSGSNDVVTPSRTLRGGRSRARPEEQQRTAREALEGPLEWEGRIEPTGVLATGGSSVILDARQDGLRRKVAVKVGSIEASSDELIRMEASLTGRLEHPSVVPVHGLVRTRGGRPAMVMKRIDGAHWGRYLRDPGRIPLPDRADPLDWHLGVLSRVCEGVAYAHSRGVVHRDLKPGNIMVGRFGEVLIIDWGIAVAVDTDGPTGLPHAATESTVIGTPAYMAPECFPGGPGPATASDIYQLGGLLYRVLGGGFPNGEGPIHAQALVARTGDRPYPDDAPEGLVAIARRALDPDPRLRHPTVESFQAALARFRKRREALPLVEDGRACLEGLRATADALAEGREPITASQRAAVYRLYGEAWFAFRHARRIDPDLQAAADGMRDTAVLLARAELAAGHIELADVALRNVDDVPSDIVEAVARARLAQAEREEHLQQLLAEEHANSPLVDIETRIAMLVAVCLAWVGEGLMLGAAGASVGARELAAGEALTLALGVALMLGLRTASSRGGFTRRAVVYVSLILGSRLLLAVCAMLVGMSLSAALVATAVLTSLIVVVGALTMNRAMWPGAVGFILASISSALRPDDAPWILAAASGLLGLNFVRNGLAFRRQRDARRQD
ncbi:MAG: hypothetical protein D6798_06850 [Deltaproteobacteria bacterium]|nr:MAG: hypothetical protein D6798_06850 [Deltaproteobacteria bacterium]